jgi:hypothetical protein
MGTKATYRGIMCLFRAECRLGLGGGFSRRVLSRRNRRFPLGFEVMLLLGMAGPAIAQDNGAKQPSALEQLQHIVLQDLELGWGLSATCTRKA